jgi:hypothetical protein
MLLRRLDLKHPVRLPTLKHNADVIEVGPNFPGLSFDLGATGGVEVWLEADDVRKCVYLIPAGNIAGAEPVAGAFAPIALKPKK